MLTLAIAWQPARGDVASIAVAPTPTIAPSIARNCVTQPVAPIATPNLAVAQAALANRNFALAAAHLQPLAENGDVVAQRLYGSLLLTGACGVPADSAHGLDWLRKAAAANDVFAQFTLGEDYLNGKVVAQDDVEAFKWFKAAADAGNYKAEANVGYMYLAGRGVAADPRQGLEWSVRAGEQGSPAALLNIAQAYWSGTILPKNPKRAYFWLCTAQQRAAGVPNVFGRIFAFKTQVVRVLSVSDAKRIEKRSESWSPGKGSLDEVLADAAKLRRDHLSDVNQGAAKESD
ncbi:MAG: sel1 repeat family protein [Alphaproteobacteria bacterium]|nr:sel1 repeat family protein [Alphaproteobacteria bacterium]